eukprot:6325500-Amphidinium_carterae.1
MPWEVLGGFATKQGDNRRWHQTARMREGRPKEVSHACKKVNAMDRSNYSGDRKSYKHWGAR